MASNLQYLQRAVQGGGSPGVCPLLLHVVQAFLGAFERDPQGLPEYSLEIALGRPGHRDLSQGAGRRGGTGRAGAVESDRSGGEDQECVHRTAARNCSLLFVSGRMFWEGSEAARWIPSSGMGVYVDLQSVQVKVAACMACMLPHIQISQVCMEKYVRLAGGFHKHLDS